MINFFHKARQFALAAARWLNQDLFMWLVWGRLVRASASSAERHQELVFEGDRPEKFTKALQIETHVEADGRRRNHARLSYECAEPPTAHRRAGLVYTPTGFIWLGATLDADSSSHRPESFKRVVEGLNRFRPERFARATVVQAEYNATYGDWITYFVKPLVLAEDVDEPLLLPARLKGRGYVTHDLDRLGISYRFCGRPARVEDCLVLRRRTTDLVWTSDEVRMFRDQLSLAPPDPEPGSLIYLSRVGVKSDLVEVSHRDTRSLIVEETIRGLGGTVVRTEGMGFSDFAALAGSAETVVADHGAALFNLLQWNARHVVELVSEEWWHPCFVSLSRTLNIPRHTILRPALYDDASLAAAIDGTSRPAPP